MEQLNLNLLRALHALLTCRHVTLASKKIGVSQSSMSISLKQLREFYNDSLLVRGQNNLMHLTPLGASLIGKTREAMSMIDGIFSLSDEFNPLIDKRIFYIGMADLVSFLLAPTLISEIEKLAPHIKLRIAHPKYLTSMEVFESDKFDLMVGMFEGVPESLKQQKLYSDEAVIVGCQDHPAFEDGKISMDNILQYPLIQLALCDTPFYNYFDRYLISMGYEKRVSVSIGQGIIPLLSLPGTNYLTLSIRSVAEKLAQHFKLQLASVPFEVETYHCFQYWHQKDNDDPAHQWLRALIKKVAKQSFQK